MGKGDFYFVKLLLPALVPLQYSHLNSYSNFVEVIAKTSTKLMLMDESIVRLYTNTDLDNYREVSAENANCFIPGKDFFAKRKIDPASGESYSIGVYRWDTLEEWCIIHLDSKGLPYTNYGMIAFEDNILFVLRTHGPFYETGPFHIDVYEIIEK